MKEQRRVGACPNGSRDEQAPELADAGGPLGIAVRAGRAALGEKSQCLLSSYAPAPAPRAPTALPPPHFCLQQSHLLLLLAPYYGAHPSLIPATLSSVLNISPFLPFSIRPSIPTVLPRLPFFRPSTRLRQTITSQSISIASHSHLARSSPAQLHRPELHP